MKKMKWLVVILTVLSLYCSLGANAHAQRIRLKLATLAPKNLGWAILFEQHISPWMTQGTEGSVVAKMYWGGIMGNDDDYLAKMRIGQLQGAGMSGWGSSLACPEFSVLGLPFLFNNYEEVDYLKEVIFPTFDYYFEQNGYKLLMWFDQDFDQFYSTKYSFETLEDFKNTKIVTWYGPQEEAMLKALGASPVPLDVTDIPTAKRTGIIDCNIAPSIWQVGAQLYTIDKYVNTMKVRYSPASFIITMDSWNKIANQYKQALMETRAQVQNKFCNGVRTDNRKCLEGMINYGVKPVHPDPQNMAEIQKRAMKVYEDMSGDLYPPDLLMEVSQHLAVYRKNSGTTENTVAVADIEAMVKSAKKKAAQQPKVAKVEDLTPEPVPVPAPAPKVEPVPEKVVEVVEVMETAKVEPPKPEPAPLPTPAEAKKVEREAVKVAAADKEYQAVKDADSKDMFAEISAAYKKTEEAKKKGAVEAKDKVAAAPSAKERQKAWATRKQLLTEVQKVLKPMGLYKFRIDGIYGPITRKGILEYQRMYGLQATGGTTREMLDHMGIE